MLLFKSGFCNEFSTVRWEMMPGPLKEAAGFHYQEFSSLKEPLSLRGDPSHVGEGNRVSDWAEMLIPDTAKPLAFYDHPFVGQYPAIMCNSYGKGSLTYEGTVVTTTLQKALLLSVLQEAGLRGPDQDLPIGMHVKHAVNRSGKTIHFFFNYSSSERTIPYVYRAGSDLIFTLSIAPNDPLALAPWGAAIIEER